MTTTDSKLLKLMNVSHTNIKDVQDLVGLINECCENLINLGHDYDNMLYVYILLKALNPSFSNLIQHIQQQEESAVTLNNYIAQAFTEEVSNKQTYDSPLP